MATVINRETGEIRFSVHTPDYSDEDFGINLAGIQAAMNVPAHYRVIDGDAVREATDGERDVVDQQRLPQLKEAKRDSVGEVLREALRAAGISELAGVMAAASTLYGQAVVDIAAATTVAQLDAISVEI